MIITPRRIASAGQDVGRNIIDVCSGLHVLNCWHSKLEECLFKMRLANHVIRKELRKIVWDGFWVSYEICTQKLVTFSISIFYWKGLKNEGGKKRRRTYKIIIQWAQIITNVKLITKKLEHDLKKNIKTRNYNLTWTDQYHKNTLLIFLMNCHHSLVGGGFLMVLRSHSAERAMSFLQNFHFIIIYMKHLLTEK